MYSCMLVPVSMCARVLDVLLCVGSCVVGGCVHVVDCFCIRVLACIRAYTRFVCVCVYVYVFVCRVFVCL